MGGACNRTCLGVSAGKRDQVGFPNSLPWLALWLSQPGRQVLETAGTPGDLVLILPASPAHLGPMPPPVNSGTLAVSRHVAAKAL